MCVQTTDCAATSGWVAVMERVTYSGRCALEREEREMGHFIHMESIYSTILCKNHCVNIKTQT